MFKIHAPLIALFLIGFISSCAPDQIKLLSERSESYNQNVRWSSVATASTFFSKGNRRDLMDTLSEKLSKSQVVDFGILDIGVDDTKKKGSVLVEYSYFGADQNLKKQRELQFWEFTDDSWFLTKTQSLPNKTKP